MFGLYLTFAIVFYIGMLVEGFKSKSFKYMKHVEHVSHAASFVERCRRAPPQVTFKIECFHHEGHGDHRRKVVTHRAEAPYYYSEWCDQSPDPQGIEFIKNHRLIRVNFKKHFDYLPIAN